MVTFLHTADWQIGATSVRAGMKSRELREIRLKAAERIILAARSRGVEFILVAGDLFDDHDVDDALVQQTVDILNSAAPIPVYILPGNHDFLGHGGIWERRSWIAVGPHVHLLSSREEVACGEDVALYPCPVLQKRSRRDPTEWIPARSEGDERIRIGLAHGSLDSIAEEANFPVRSDRVEESDLDYLALGDWHGRKVIGRAVYPGTPEQTSFGEVNTGSALVVSIAHSGDTPLLDPVVTGSLEWIEIAEQMREVSDVEHLERKVRSVHDIAHCLFRVSVAVGPSLDSNGSDRLRDLRKWMKENAFHLEWPEESLRSPFSADQQIPSGLFSEVELSLSAMLDGHMGTTRVDSEVYSREDVEEALYLLRDYIRRARP